MIYDTCIDVISRVFVMIQNAFVMEGKVYSEIVERRKYPIDWFTRKRFGQVFLTHSTLRLHRHN